MRTFIETNIRWINIYKIILGLIEVIGAILIFYYTFIKIVFGDFDWIILISFSIIILILGLFGFNFIKTTIKYILHPEKNPIREILSMYGNYIDIVNSIEKEINNKENINNSYNNLLITQNWLFKITTLNFIPIYKNDIAWVYKKITKNKLENVVTVSKDYGVIIKTRKWQEVEIPLSKEKTDELIDFIKEINNNILIGYNEEIVRKWRENSEILQEKSMKINKY